MKDFEQFSTRFSQAATQRSQEMYTLRTEVGNIVQNIIKPKQQEGEKLMKEQEKCMSDFLGNLAENYLDFGIIKHEDVFSFLKTGKENKLMNGFYLKGELFTPLVARFISKHKDELMNKEFDKIIMAECDYFQLETEMITDNESIKDSVKSFNNFKPFNIEEKSSKPNPVYEIPDDLASVFQQKVFVNHLHDERLVKLINNCLGIDLPYIKPEN